MARADQHVYDLVKPERDQNKRAVRRKNWWFLAENAPKFRRAIASLQRWIATPYTAKHRVFFFEDARTLPDAMVYAIASDQASVLGILSSRIHSVWSLAVGGLLGPTPRYNSRFTFNPFPFPEMDENRKLLVGEAADQLEAHRRQQQSQHAGLTITDLYNVLEKVRRKEELTATDKAVHQQGLVSVLNKIHENLDAAVAEAYGWPVDLSDEEILRRLVALNAERAEEEKRGIIRWLRPEFQNPGGAATTQQSLAIAGIEAKPVKAAGRAKKPAWPKEMVGQVLAVRGALTAGGGPLSPGDVAAKFKGVKEPVIAELLVALEALGQARRVDGGRYAA